MLRSVDLGKFYLDLQNPDFKTSFAVYHRRFSTNTVPKWFLAQPMRMLAHNGEINTLLGNINWVKSRQYAFRNARKASQRMQCLIEDGEASAECANLEELGIAEEVDLAMAERPDQIMKTIKVQMKTNVALWPKPNHLNFHTIQVTTMKS
jgi:glutamate synthase domain-containing protein 1